MCLPFSRKKKIIAQFYKNSREKLIIQLKCYVSELYGFDMELNGNHIETDYEIFCFRAKYSNTSVKIKCKITENKLNHKMTIHEICKL